MLSSTQEPQGKLLSTKGFSLVFILVFVIQKLVFIFILIVVILLIFVFIQLLFQLKVVLGPLTGEREE